LKLVQREGYCDTWVWDEADGPEPDEEEMLRLWAEHCENEPPLREQLGIPADKVIEGCGGSSCDHCYPGEV